MRPETTRAAIAAIAGEARWKRIAARIEKRCAVKGGFTTEVEFLPGSCGTTPETLHDGAQRMLHPESSP
jgi:hypothetical protein